MIVICCGMIRSGSTLQYQITKELVEQMPGSNIIGWVEKEDFYSSVKKINPDDINLFKVHEFPEILDTLNGTIKYIYVHRDPRDVVVSVMKKVNRPFFKVFSNELIRLAIIPYKKYKQVKNIKISRYANVRDNLSAEIKQVAEFLNIKVDDDFIEKLSEKLAVKNQKSQMEKVDSVSNTKDKFNRDTLLHHNHIISGKDEMWKKELSLLQVYLVELVCYDVLLELNYQPHFSFNSRFISPYFSNGILSLKNLFLKFRKKLK